MPELEDLIMSSQISASPEETPEDRMRAALMQRLGVAPEVRAKQMSDQVLGQGGKGFSGLMNRIFGGAHEGLRVAQDPKYRGAYQEALGTAMEQEKNLMPYARQLEMSGAMRDKAKLVAQEQARNTFAKVFDTITKSINTKYANETARSKALSQAKVDEAEIKQLLTRGDYLGAQTKLLETQNKWLAETGAKELPNEVVSYGVLTGQKPGESNFGKDFFGFQSKKSLANKAGDIVKNALAPRTPTTSTTYTEQLVPGIDTTGQKIMTRVPKVSTNLRQPGARPDISSVLNVLGLSGPGNTADAEAEAATSPEDISSPPGAPTPPAPAQPINQAALSRLTGKKAAPLATPAPVGSAPSVVKTGVYATRADAEAATGRKLLEDKISDTRHILGNNLGKLLPKLGRLSGNPTMRELQKLSQDPAIGLGKEFEQVVVQFDELTKEYELYQRLFFTGRQSNQTEMKEIKSFLPNTEDTYNQALLKAVGREVFSKFHNERLKRSDLDAPYVPGRLQKFARYATDLYLDAYQEKDPKKREQELKEIDGYFNKDFIWKYMTTKPKGAQ